MTFPSCEQSPPMQGSKWLSVQALLNDDEVKELLVHLRNPLIYLVGVVSTKDTCQINCEEFISIYRHYIECLRNEKIPLEKDYQKAFSASMTHCIESVCVKELPQNEIVLRPCLPVVQMQAHRFRISDDDFKLRSMVFGKESISWGLQFSFPQLYQKGFNNPIEKVPLHDKNNINSTMFFSLQRWLREYSVPTTFTYKNHKVASSIRLGKNCFDWINRHPQLSENGIRILHAGNHE